MTKLYAISIAKHQHDIDTACVMLRNRISDAADAGDMAAVIRLEARLVRAEDYRERLIGCCGCGWFTGEEFADCRKMISWVRESRIRL